MEDNDSTETKLYQLSCDFSRLKSGSQSGWAAAIQGGGVDFVDLSGNMARMKNEIPVRMKNEL